MSMAYNPKTRANDFQVEYVVKTTGDRWFSPYTDGGTTAEQVARCSVMCGKTTDGTTAGKEVVAS